MAKKIKIFLTIVSVICIIFGVLTFLLSMKFYNEFNCISKHYPDKFIEVELTPVSEIDTQDSVFDRGKAVYNYTYIVGNIRYKTEIASKEFNDKFYVCEDNPREAFSEHDIKDVNKQLIFSIVTLIIGFIPIIIDIKVIIIKILIKKDYIQVF